MDNKDTGLLLNKQNIELHRMYFKQMLKLRGINVLYRAPQENKHYRGHGELDAYYDTPILTSCIFEEHINQKTAKKMGWNHELVEGTSIIHVPYDLPGLQEGALFIIPSGLDNAEGRVFKVIQMSTIAVYPASISCEIGPMLVNTYEPSQNDYSKSNFNLLVGEE